MGFDDAEAAKSGYLSNYDKNWKGLGEITEASVEDFKAWTKRPRKSKQPFALPVKPKKEEAVTKDQEDWGKKITTARKNISVRWNENSTDEEISSKPLSKTWPEKEFDDVGDTYASAFAFAARGEIPRKPSQSYKKQRWVEKVKNYRQLVKDNVVDGLLTGKITKEKMKELGGKRNLQDFFAKVDLLSELDRKDWSKVERVLSYPDSMDFNPKTDKLDIPNPKTYVRINGRNREFNSTDPKVLAEQIKPFLEEKVEKPQMKFEVRGRKGSYFINKKGDPEYTRLATFDSSKEAFDFIKNNNSKLVESWESHKARVNVTKADIRNKVNKPRTGEDYRNGKNATAEDFQNTFGIKRGTFGKWVKQGKERQDMLNGTYDALMDLANITGVPPKALSLEGKLGFAFGANGRGKAMAHYEPGEVVINLTKTKGAGSLAHEWFHALDNYFQKKRDTLPTTEKGNFITHNPETYYIGPRGYSVPESRFRDMRGINKNEWRRVEGVRPEVAESFKNLVDTLNGLDFAKRSSRLDKGKAGGYWSSNLEMAARAFESYVKAKMSANGYDNDFLANVTSDTDFVRDDNRYPYIKADEIAEVEAAFDDLFNTIESKESDNGDVALFRQGDGPTKTKVKVDGKLFETGKPVTFPYLHNKDSATKMFGIPDKESPFGRGFEPSAKYVTYHDGDKPSYGDFETGEITFNNPLVIDNDNLNWKQALSESYGGKTGKALSKAIIKDGFDGIVTVDGKSISEIVDLTTFDESKALFSAAGTVTSNTNTRTVSRSNANEIVSRFVKGLSSAGKNYVSVVSTYDDLPTDIKYAAKAQGAEYQVKGVFHKGKVHVVLDQHTSALDMETTLFHEAYGHLGIKNLFGDDITKKLNSLFIANGGLKGLRETAKRHGINLEQYIKGLDGTNMPQEVKNRVLMDELLAHMQQSNKPSVKRLAREIVGMVRDKLRKLGLPGLSKVTDSDLFYTLKKARDAANNGPSKSPGETLFRTTDDAAAFSAPVEKKWSKDWFKRKLQDKFAPIKDMQANIEDATGRELPEDQNAYRAEELFYGKTENDLNKMEKNHVKPLVDAMTSNNIDSAELDQFLIAKHARERNAHIASINPEMQDGGSGMTNAEADAILSRYEQEGKLRGLEAAASEVYKITQKRRELMRDAGLEDESLLDVWDATYEFYVPLKGYAEDSEGNSVAKTGSGFDIRGKESMRAMGRRTIAESPTAHAIQDLSATIIRSRKNEVGRTFLKMVEENPNPDIWEVFTEDNPDTERRIVNGEVKENQPIDMRSRKDDYFSVKVDGQSKYIKLKDKDGLLMKAMKNMGPEQMNTFTRSMSEVTRWLSMVNTSLNPEFTVTNFTRDIQTALFNALAEQDLTDGKVKDKAIAMKMIKGSGKAVKSLWQHSAGKLDEADPMYKWIEEFLSDGAKTGYFDSKEVDKIGTDLADLLDMANGTNKGKLLKAKHKIGDFIENVNGGIENGVRLSSYIEARKAGVTREKAASFAKNLTVNFNRKGEIGTFLNSLYMFFNAAVQGNANFARAIITPKVDEVTGKKSLNMAQKVAVGISLASFGWAALMREMAGDDEDDVPYWDKIPKGVRERNFIIPKTLWGGEPGEYLKIPLPYGYNIFYNLGDAAEAAINSDTRKTGDLAAEMALSVYASFVPLGSPVGDNGAESAFLAGTPTIGKPLIEIALNKNFFGGPIYRENNPYGAQLRDSQMSMRSTGEAYKWMTGFMNDVIGDGRSYKVKGESPWYDVSPDSIEHLVEFSLGGLYRFGSRIYDNVAKSAQGGDLDSTDIPFARQLNGKVQPYADITQFYEARQQLKNIDAEMDSLRGKERLEFRKEYGDKLRLQSLMSSLDKRMKQLRKQRDRVEINESLSYEEKEKRLQKIEDQMKTTAARFNKQWNKVN
ncbi:LPD38 domain-containing protein [Alteromonas mediterranea]|uniref:LPD38 domain-containing protein n=1 Tax=Alteromonas mediterranea TaxID=314275 RepID=UPI00241C71B1|nr:LPD38 domain-containing protein [Alteromonas mediterranea]